MRCFPIVQGSMFPGPAEGVRCARWLRWNADGYAIGGLSVGEPRPLSMEMVEATEPLLPQRQAALRHGRRHAGGTARICRARRRHDGLRTALAQRPQRLPVHVGRPRDHQACALPG